MDRNFRLRLPAPITNDAGYTLKKASNNAPAAHSELYAKLCKLQHISRQTSTSKESKRMQRRTDFVLSYQAKEEGASTSLLAPFKQTIDLSLKDSYVSFGTNHVNAGQLAGAKTTALVLTEDQRKAVEAGAPGEQRQEIGAKPGRNALKKAKKIEREKTKGDAWYGLPAPEMTDEIKRDLEVLQMRGALDPKRFYKKNDTKELPKYFQMGRYVDAPADFYSERLTKKAKKKTLVDELLADAEFRRYNKRKYAEIIEHKSKFLPKHQRGKLAKKIKRDKGPAT